MPENVTGMASREALRLSNEESNRLTREALGIAMVRLMDEKDFDRITITEITRLAGVSRPSFYRNYQTKEALIADIGNSLFTALQETLGSELYRCDRKKWYVSFFQSVREHSDYFQIYLNAHLQFGEMLALETVYPPSTTLEHYRNSARQGAFLQILTDWFTGGMKERAQEMGEICYEVIYRRYGNADGGSEHEV